MTFQVFRSLSITSPGSEIQLVRTLPCHSNEGPRKHPTYFASPIPSWHAKARPGTNRTEKLTQKLTHRSRVSVAKTVAGGFALRFRRFAAGEKVRIQLFKSHYMQDLVSDEINYRVRHTTGISASPIR